MILAFPIIAVYLGVIYAPQYLRRRKAAACTLPLL